MKSTSRKAVQHDRVSAPPVRRDIALCNGDPPEARRRVRIDGRQGGALSSRPNYRSGGRQRMGPPRRSKRGASGGSMSSPHSKEDELVATDAIDAATLLAENAALRDRLL